MNQKPSKLKAVVLLFAPSWMGTVVYTFLSLTAIVVNQFESVRSFLQIPQNVQLMRIVSGWADTALVSVIGKSNTETFVVGLFWAIVGLVVYLFLRGVAQFMSTLDEKVTARSYVWPRGSNRYAPIRKLLEQGALRIGALIGLIYVVFVPLAAVLRGPVFVMFFGESQVVRYIVWFVASYLAWHLVVIMLRFITLRARLSG